MLSMRHTEQGIPFYVYVNDVIALLGRICYNLTSVLCIGQWF